MVFCPLFWEGPELRGEVDFRPAHFRNFGPALTCKNEKLDEFRIGLLLPASGPPDGPEFLICQYTIPRGFSRGRPNSRAWVGVYQTALDGPAAHGPKCRKRPVGLDRTSALDDGVQNRVNVGACNLRKPPAGPWGGKFFSEQPLDFLGGTGSQI